jgi:hypothetical protein
MADLNRNDNINAQRTATGGAGATMGDWSTEESWWRDNWSRRPYARADRGFDYYGPALRYGYESASRHRGRNWNDVESDLRRGWDKFEYRSKSTWEDIKEAVRDAWDHVTGQEHEMHSRR